MNRSIDRQLVSWKTDPFRKPLLIRGARQVGKSFSVREFAKACFKTCIEINFELQPQFKKCFVDLDPARINESISLLAKTSIVPGETLLFLDEIQECPQAITALRYYYELLPDLHVIAAGSLLEFVMESGKIHVPVGRIQYLFMHPMSLSEFFEALGESALGKAVSDPLRLATLNPAVHEHALDLLRKYCLVGGMPAVVKAYVASRDLAVCSQLQSAITQSYRDDFGKYASRAKHEYLDQVFVSVPRMVGEKFKYSRVDAEVPSRGLREALHLLEKACVVHRVRRTSGTALPLEAGADDRNFKALFVDIGLMQNLSGMTEEIAGSEDILAVLKGAIAEQFVGQELIAAHDNHTKPALFYWARHAPGSAAEVDYLVALHAKIIPIEVKSGASGRSLTAATWLPVAAAGGGLLTTVKSTAATISTATVARASR
jgi:predicted AAA+ superfamily ATPase